jgi:hypothetical protein
MMDVEIDTDASRTAQTVSSSIAAIRVFGVVFRSGIFCSSLVGKSRLSPKRPAPVDFGPMAECTPLVLG